jgi:short-subunit dehydrogenase
MPTAIITGASRGQGYENAKGLAALGYDIVMIAKDQSRLSLAQQTLQRHHPDQNFITYDVDLEDQDATRKTVEIIAQQQLAAGALWLATREFNPGDPTGVLWEDNQIVEW